MGDKSRHRIFAEFIVRTFPHAQYIADVAGGHGELSFWLYEFDKKPVIIDPRDTHLPKWIHRSLRKRSIRAGKLFNIERLKKDVRDVDLSRFDLIVALHPDEATEPALLAALENDKDFAIVPCCVFPLDGKKRSQEEWISYLSSFTPDIKKTRLPISGANIVLWRKQPNGLPISKSEGKKEDIMTFRSNVNDYTQIERRVKKYKMTPSLSVSIIIPFYQGASILEKSLFSLTNQTYPKDLMEVIVVQDEGAEDIDNMVDKFRDYYDIKLLKLKHLGFTPARSRNEGIKRAKGDVIFSMDFDIICPPNTIWNHMKWFHVSDKVATFGLRKFIDASGYSPQEVPSKIDELMKLPNIPSISNTIEGCKLDKRLPEIEIIKSHPFPCNCFHGCNIAYRRDTAIKVGLWDEDFNFYYGREDMEFGYRLWKSGTFIVYVPDAMVLHQENKIVPKDQKEKGLKRNLTLLYEKVPGIKNFREEELPRIHKKFGW